MRRLFLFLFIVVFCSGFTSNSVEKIGDVEKKIKKALPEFVIYTKVPRGLIISVDENILFNGCDNSIKDYSFLDIFAEILKNLPNYCVIEAHNQVNNCNFENWELSMIRSANITEYLIKCKQVPNEQIFDIGYGEFMPLQKLKNRIDFVLIDYEALR